MNTGNPGDSNKSKPEPVAETGSSTQGPPAGPALQMQAPPPKPTEKPLDDWTLQADRIAVTSPLVSALQILAGHYGRRSSPAGLTSGLPIPTTGITPALFIRAAERADLNARMAQRSLESLAIAPNLPCILTLQERQACILWDINHPAKRKIRKGQKPEEIQLHPDVQFIVQFPETPDEKTALMLPQLQELYTGYAFFARPVARSDERAGPAAIESSKDWFWGAFKRNKTLYKEVVVAAMMINLFAVVTSLFTMNVYDRVVPNNAFETLWALSIGVLIVYIFDFVLKYLRSQFLDHAGRKADVQISADLFEQILGMTMQSRPASAGILASRMREFETIRDFFTSATMATIVDLPFVLIFIAFIGVVAGPLALIPLISIPLVLAVGLALQKQLTLAVKDSLNESALKNALLFETFTGLETIKVQAAEGHIQRSWEELNEKASRTSVRMRNISSLASYWSAFIQQVAGVLMIVAGVYMISEGMLTMGALIAAVLLSGRAMGPLGQVAGLMTRYNQSKQSLEHLDKMMKNPVERPVGKHFTSMPDMRGAIEFQNVVFSYPGQTVPAVNEMNFCIEAGERVGIIGAVGSGKTTIERLLLNLYEPSSGSVQIDGTDVRQIDPGDLRRSVGAVQQSPQLFFGTVRYNITMGHETAPDRAVLRAAELSGVMDFLRDSSAGLDTQVGERGEALSGGQRQAVAIARSLLYDPPILILDEPTASMDPASENRLCGHLARLCEGKTTIVITHKATLLNLVDKLILIDRGRLVAYGPKDDVIRKLQARQYETQPNRGDAS
ncbi:MAG: type I secretion system permease/ATPase [Alphaproteobacteria bacterium]